MGQNGTGKSVWATAIARGWDRGSIVIYDPKDDPEARIPNCFIARTADEAIAHLPGRVLYRPTSSEFTARKRGDRAGTPPIWLRFDEIMRKLLDLARRAGEAALVIIHELADLGTQFSNGQAFGEVVRKGRSLGITLVMVTQRPLGTPLIARSEAQHVVAFTLTDSAARQCAAELLADVDRPEMADAIRLRPLPLNHTWWYRGPDFRLRLHSPLPYR